MDDRRLPAPVRRDLLSLFGRVPQDVHEQLVRVATDITELLADDPQRLLPALVARYRELSRAARDAGTEPEWRFAR